MAKKTAPSEDDDFSQNDEAVANQRRSRWSEDPRLKPLPPRYSDARPNIEHFRHKYACLNALSHSISMGWEDMPRGFNLSQAKDLIDAEVKVNGFDPKHIADIRSEAEKLQDFLEQMKRDPESIDQIDHSTLIAAEKRLDEDQERTHQQFALAIEGCGKIINNRIQEQKDAEHPSEVLKRERERHEARQRRGKTWLDRIRREIRLRDWMTATRVPAGINPVTMASAHKAARPLYFMLKFTRSTTAKLWGDSDSTICRIGLHHCEFAVAIWEARNGIRYMPTGTVPGTPCGGVVIIAPPGHGKSQFVSACLGMEFCENPKAQVGYLHGKDDMALRYTGYITEMFTNNNPMGNRVRAVYPKAIATKYNKNELWMAGAGNAKTPSMQAAGVMSDRQGTDMSLLVLDDITPQSDRDEPTTRERRFERITGVWFQRLRGGHGFTICIGTLWHHQDALSKLAKMTQRSLDESAKNPKKGEKLFLVLRKYTGGPTTTPQFIPLWPEVYPASDLRKRYETMGRNRQLWSASYEANPISDESRLIRKLRYYDPTADEHVAFMQSAQSHVSLDPSATNKETSDRVGIVHAGLGEVEAERDGVRFYQTRMRILDAQAIYANQVELVDHTANYVSLRPVYQVHVETRSGFHATADIFEDRYGLQVIRHDPTNRSKEIRLKACAGVIDDSSSDFRALVEFPGIKNENGELVCDPRFEWLRDQFLDFGVTDQDHCLDATTQIVNHFLRNGELEAGMGEATKIVREVLKQRGDPRVLAILGEARQDQRKTELQEDDAWLKQMNDRW